MTIEEIDVLLNSLCTCAGMAEKYLCTPGMKDNYYMWQEQVENNKSKIIEAIQQYKEQK